jgi:hypothetical protein
LFNHLGALMEIGVRFSPYLPLIQVEPCSYGSMINGHLEQLETKAAFSILIGSDGKS